MLIYNSDNNKVLEEIINDYVKKIRHANVKCFK